MTSSQNTSPSNAFTGRDADNLVRSYGRTSNEKVQSIQQAMTENKVKQKAFEMHREQRMQKNSNRVR
jgi:hypothetical protein